MPCTSAAVLPAVHSLQFRVHTRVLVTLALVAAMLVAALASAPRVAGLPPGTHAAPSGSAALVPG